MAGALHRHHRFSGIVFRHSSDGPPVQEGYRKTLQHALQWYDVTLSVIDCGLSKELFGHDAILGVSDIDPASAFVPASTELAAQVSASIQPSDPPSAHWTRALEAHGLSLSQPTLVDPALVQRCPSCFNTKGFDVDFSRGGDVHIAVDGNFNQKHCESAGDCPAVDFRCFNFVPRWWVDAVDAALEAAGRKPRPYTGIVPEAAVDACENSHKAGRGDQKAAGVEHDDKGLIAVVCRHSIPLLLCNVDTAGERQKYATALIIWLLLRVPSSMKIVVLYDIACVTYRTLNTHNVLVPGMLEQLAFATAAMHAYAHQMIVGMGLTDGEGVERLWSLLVNLLGILRRCSRSRRIIVLERQIQWIADCLREELGRWASRRRHTVDEKRADASHDLAACGYAVETLRSLWELQRKSQLSVRRATQPLMRQDMKTISDLQDTVDALDDKIDSAELNLTRGRRNAKIKHGLGELRNKRDQLHEHIQSLYESLNVADDFPHIKTLGSDFVRLLVEAHNTKSLLRARVIGRIFEFHYLDRAVGGRDIPLGYKQNQRRRQQLKSGNPIIQRLHARYNGLVENLHDFAKRRKINFPLPQPLPPNILSLRDDPALLEDVWLGSSEDNAPLWLTDPKVRIGIRAMHILDRCNEESARLEREQAQLTDWLVTHWKRIQTKKANDLHGRCTPWLRDEDLQLEDLAVGCGIKNLSRWAQSRLEVPESLPNRSSQPSLILPRNPQPDIPQSYVPASTRLSDDGEDSADTDSDWDDVADFEGQRDIADDLVVTCFGAS
ncbi:hypothetical protein BKA62DRAFT_786834 [Auriculariales sp. MPI-PUGE-AT-0066]|nr:hypothetical protein BKA62DRAFT_786834 [Auriculariales sp. MPI-PUGE-AT-0066]